MPVSATASASAAVVTLEFSGSVVANGRPAFHVTTRSLLHFNTTTPTTLTLYFSGPCETLAWSFDGTTPTLNAVSGATIVPASGRFGGTMPITADDILIADGAGGMIGGRGSIDSTGTASLSALLINTNAFRAYGDGTGDAANGNIAWDSAGNLAATSLNVGGGRNLLNNDGTANLANGTISWDAAGNLAARSYTNAANTFVISLDGSGRLAGSGIQWDASGNLTAASFTGAGSALTGLTIAQISGLQTTLDNLANAINTIQNLLATGVTGTTSTVNTITSDRGVITAIS